jgi:hypothetical protein
MLALRELNERIGNLRDVRVSQVARDGDDVALTFTDGFTVRLLGVTLFRDEGVANAPLAAGIAFINAEEDVEVWLDDVGPRGEVQRRLQAIAAKAVVVT